MTTTPVFRPFSFDPIPLEGGARSPFAERDAEPAPPVDAVWSNDTCDDTAPDESTPDAMDVRILWGTTVLHFEQLSPPRPFILGDAGSDFVLPNASRDASVPLVTVGDESVAGSVFLPPSARIEVVLADGQRLTRDTAVERGIAVRSAVHDGAHDVFLPRGATARLTYPGSDLTFEVTRVRARETPASGILAGADLSGQLYTGLSALVHATLVGALAFFLPAMHADDAEATDRNVAAAMQPYLAAIAEREPEHQELPASADSASAGGGSGGAAARPSGALGSTTPRTTEGRYAIRGDAQTPQLARQHALEEASTFGLLNVLSGDPMNAPTAFWGQDAAVGADPRSALGKMWMPTIDDATGAGGLGMSGTDEGGGGLAAGIGINGIGSTVGHGAGDWPGGDGPGHGPGKGRWGTAPVGLGGHVPTGPVMREKPITTFGGTLPQEVVQRVVRQNFGRFRLCYEAGLRANPGLTGRVAVAFVIDRDGSVAVASNEHSTDMPDPNVVACVVRGFQNLSFPAPKDGTVRVIYPLMLSPGQ